ncbi:MAG: holo-ACP synthase [Gemmatimonadaceae bacterium]
MTVGLGVDIVVIERVSRMLATHGDRLLRRLFTAAEVEYCSSRARPEQHYAARIAAKEAAFKALAGTSCARLIGWREIEVISGEHGIPALKLHGRAKDRGQQLGVQRIHVSLSHDGVAAHATVLLEAD